MQKLQRDGAAPYAETATRFHNLASVPQESARALAASGLHPLGHVAGLRSFKDFGAWQLAYALRCAVRPLCQRALDARDFKLHGQIREAARSATRNIAEGFGRFTHGDFARFVRIAKASEVELLDHFNEAFDSGYLSDTERRHLEHAAKKAIKAANGLIRYLDSTPDAPSPRSRRGGRAP